MYLPSSSIMTVFFSMGVLPFHIGFSADVRFLLWVPSPHRKLLYGIAPVNSTLSQHVFSVLTHKKVRGCRKMVNFATAPLLFSDCNQFCHCPRNDLSVNIFLRILSQSDIFITDSASGSTSFICFMHSFLRTNPFSPRGLQSLNAAGTFPASFSDTLTYHEEDMLSYG